MRVAFNDEVKCRGIFELRVIDRNGNVVENYIDRNLIVNLAKDALAALIASADPTKKVSQIGIGSNGTAPDPLDTSLTDAFIKPLDGFSFPDTGQVSFSWSIDYGEGNGIPVQEFGLLTADGNLFARKTRGVITKESDLRLEGTWTVIF